MAAIQGDDIIAEGEPEKLNRLGEVLKQLVVVKVVDRIGPGAEEHVRYLRRDTSCTSKDRDSSSETPCCDHQKPFQDRCAEALDEFEDAEAKLHQRDTGN